ncbi:hypothetical protein D9M72_361600 [compost metagenome]
MRIGQDQPVRAHDKARAQSAHQLLLATLRTLELRPETLEELEQRIVRIDARRHLRRGALGARGDADIDYGRPVLCHDAGEIRRRGHGGRRLHRRDGWRRCRVPRRDDFLLQIGIAATKGGKGRDTNGRASNGLAHHVWFLSLCIRRRHFATRHGHASDPDLKQT